MLTNTEKNRYDRHLKLSEVGLEGQELLKAAKVLVVGAGGLGCPILQYLTAAGVGTIGVIDDDVIDESNLQRQVLFGTDDTGKHKVTTAINKLKTQNPFVVFKEFKVRLTNKNVLELFQEYDIIVDGTDNFSTRYLINDACVISNKPLVYGSIYKFEGQISVFNYNNGPSYRCLFPSPPKENQLPNCSEIGVLGVLPGVIGTLQATEVLKIILQKGTVLSGQLRIMNLLENSNLTLAIERNQIEIDQVLQNGLLDDYQLFCGVEVKLDQEVYTIEDIEVLKSDSNVVFMDVREEWEQPRVPELKALEISLDELEESIQSIPRDKKVIVFCQTGGRSQQVISFLGSHFDFTNLYSLEGGILNYNQ
jgi:adenylyltransferase/sulfurtransferase